jgi:toxin HigB-1
VIRSFRDKATEDLFNGVASEVARQRLPNQLWRIGSRKLDVLDQAETLDDLRVSPGNRLEVLKGDRAGQHSIRINDQFRICFVWSDGAAEDVAVVDYH